MESINRAFIRYNTWLIILGFALLLASQSQGKDLSASAPGDSVATAVDNWPEIIGGYDALFKNLVYPKKCRRAQMQGRIIVQFIASKTGEVQDLTIVQGIGGGCDQAVLDAIELLSFKPATKNGQPVDARLTIPFHYKLESGITGDDEKIENQPSTTQNVSDIKKGLLFQEVIIVGYFSPHQQKLEIPQVSTDF